MNDISMRVERLHEQMRGDGARLEELSKEILKALALLDQRLKSVENELSAR